MKILLWMDGCEATAIKQSGKEFKEVDATEVESEKKEESRSYFAQTRSWTTMSLQAERGERLGMTRLGAVFLTDRMSRYLSTIHIKVLVGVLDNK